jgi:DNA polymerase III subunit delta
MKLEKAALTAALKKWPQELRAALVFGRDASLARAYLNTISKMIVADLSDPFRVTDMTEADIKKDPAKLGDEAAALSMLGGRRLVRLSGGDDLVDALQNAIANPACEAMMVIESGDLSATSKLRKWAESAPDVAAIICYPEDARSLVPLLQGVAKEHKYRLTDEAAQLIVAASGAVRDVALSELEKTMLYVGNTRTTIDAPEVMDISADAGAAGFDGLISALCRDDGARVEAHLGRLLSNGEAGIAILRVVSKRLWLLGKAHADAARGGDRDLFIQRAFGKMAWKEKPGFAAQLQTWSAVRVERGLSRLLEADRKSKLSGASAELVSAQALLGLVRSR